MIFVFFRTKGKVRPQVLIKIRVPLSIFVLVGQLCLFFLMINQKISLQIGIEIEAMLTNFLIISHL